MEKDLGFEKFLSAYLECMLWASTDLYVETDQSFDSSGYGPDDIEKNTLDSIRGECRDFLESFGHLITEENFLGQGGPFEHAGHDFFLTRNRHGAGFWDGAWKTEVGKELTQASHPYGSTYFFVNEQNKIQSV